MYGSSFNNSFTKQEIEQYNINNTIAYQNIYTKIKLSIKILLGS